MWQLSWLKWLKILIGWIELIGLIENINWADWADWNDWNALNWPLRFADALIAFMTDLDSALPSLRGHMPLNIIMSQSTPPSVSLSGYHPVLSPLNESDLNSPGLSPTQSSLPSKWISLFMLANWGGSQALECTTLFDQPPAGDSFNSEAGFLKDSIGVFTVHNRDQTGAKLVTKLVWPNLTETDHGNQTRRFGWPVWSTKLAPNSLELLSSEPALTLKLLFGLHFKQHALPCILQGLLIQTLL